MAQFLITDKDDDVIGIFEGRDEKAAAKQAYQTGYIEDESAKRYSPYTIRQLGEAVKLDLSVKTTKTLVVEVPDA